MIERYGLLNIIVLGETFIAITAMIQLERGAIFPSPDLLWLAILSAIIAFSLWGLYFTDEDHLASDELGHALLWGYGHFALFAAGAAVGAGMIVMLKILDGLDAAIDCLPGEGDSSHAEHSDENEWDAA